MSHIKFKCITNAATWQQMFCRQNPPPQGPGAQNSTFSKHGHVAYRIKGNNECSNMVANILPADPHLPNPNPGMWGQNVKIQLFQNMVLLIIKLKEMEHRAPCKAHILSLHTPPTWNKGKINLYVVMVHIKLRGRSID